MVKQRFDASDVRAMVRDLRGRLLGMRLSNLYDVNAKTYILKLAEPGRDREFLVLESGTRFHSTRFELDKSPMPSGFSMKLRKHLRTKRLEDLRQLGTDRVVIMSFGVGESRNHLILELYSQGNIVLTGPDYSILALLRVHDYDSGASVRVGAIYPLADATTAVLHTSLMDKGVGDQVSPMTRSDSEGVDSFSSVTVDATVTAPGFREWLMKRMQELQMEFERRAEEAKAKGGKKNKVHSPATVPFKSLVLSKGCSVSVFGASIVEHALLCAGVKPNMKIPTSLTALEDTSRCPFLADTSEEANHVSAAAPLGSLGRCLFELSRCAEVFSNLDRPGQQGYIILKEKKTAEDQKEDEVYVEFLPALLKQHEQLPALAFDSFDEAVDKYFSSLESQKLAQQAAAAEASAKRKLDAIKGDHNRRVDGLQREEQRLAKCAQAVQDSAEIVDEALKVVQSALEYNVTWNDLNQLIAAETAAGHPVASCIAALRLDDDVIEMDLPVFGELYHEAEDDADEEPDMEQLEEQENEEVVALGAFEGSSTSEPDESYDSPLATDTNSETKLLSSEVVPEPLTERPWWDVDDEDLLDLDWDDDAPGSVMEEQSMVGASNAGARLQKFTRTIRVELQLGDTAHANARRLWQERRMAAEKLEKTEKVADSVFAKAEAATKQQLEATNMKRELQAARKKLWFEKFHFFVTTENYLVIGGRDAQQNELLVRRYLRAGDAYVHADLHGASSCILRNKDPSGRRQLSPIALAEAGHFCVCRSSAWASKTSGCTAWWVQASQVSKSAPTGEYLPTGSFMVRGRKNYLPTVPLELGIGILFYLHEESVASHVDERYDRFTASEATEAEPQAVKLHEDPSSSGGAIEEKGHGDTRTSPAKTPEPQNSERGDKGRPQDQGEPFEDDGGAGVSASKKQQRVMDTPPTPEEIQIASKELSNLSKSDFLRQGRVMPKEKKILKRRQDATLEQIRDEEAERRLDAKRKHLEDVVYYHERAEQAAKDEARDEGRPLNTNVRGKKGKLRKIKRKYRDQDAEDRRLADLVNHGGNAALAQALADEADAFADSLSEQGGTDEPGAESKEAWATLVNESEAILEKFDPDTRDALESAASAAGIKLSGPDADVPPAELPQLLTLSQDSVPAVFQAFRTLLERYTFVQSTTFRSRALRGKVSRALARLIRRAAALEEEAKERQDEVAEELAESVGNLDASMEGVDEEPISRRAIARKEQAEIAALLEEEGVGALEGAGDGSDVDVLNRLTGKPLPGDILLNAVPFVAPYATVLPYRYRAKLIPGRGKKGRVGKQAIETMCAQAEEEEQRKLRILKALQAEGDGSGERRRSPKDVQQEIDLFNRERAAIRAIADTDLVQQMVGESILSLPSAQKSKKGSSKAKRGKRKG